MKERSKFWHFATKNETRGVFGDFVNMAIVEPMQNRKRIKELEEKQRNEKGEIIFIWPGHVPQDQAIHAMNVIEKTIGFKPKNRYEPIRYIDFSKTPGEHYADEIKKVVSEGKRKFDAIVTTNISFRNDMGKVDGQFIRRIKKAAKDVGLPFYFISSYDLYGSRDISPQTEELKNLRNSTWSVEELKDLLVRLSPLISAYDKQRPKS